MNDLHRMFVYSGCCYSEHMGLSVLVYLYNILGSHHFFIPVVVKFNLHIESSHENGHILFSASAQDSLLSVAESVQISS